MNARAERQLEMVKNDSDDGVIKENKEKKMKALAERQLKMTRNKKPHFKTQSAV
ncbi:hypothetical protein HPC37_10215 [Pasteurellaceae bacterium 20609_3]|uniref:hypothetical protein n=1 Tax=Spirabiliibacterium mucosae TaxID=28156 RepID=UPI001AADE0EE|nr:hypothetical protein [Spirabiliibacterium mucosae]MBE2899135.1 hypothetical protein [Spirabiliibacterium mucosae]